MNAMVTIYHLPSSCLTSGGTVSSSLSSEAGSCIMHAEAPGPETL